MKSSICFVLCLLITASCNKKVEPDCGCEGKTSQTLDNTLAVYTKGVSPNVISVIGGYFYLPCNPAFIEGKVTPGDTIFVSGKAHANCYKGESLIALPAYLEVTALRRK